MERARGRGVRLFLDLPLGVHPSGYDTWREREIFVQGISVGAPPDSVFTSGQNWGFPPMHPEWLRRAAYRPVLAFLRHHMQHAGALRIDHVMGLHRLYWIPHERPSSEGVFVRYRSEELYAILSLESHRHGCVIVGENLGTVPAYVNAAMRRHGICGMHVAEYELASPRGRSPRNVPRETVASVNTHDMPPFAAYWRGEDISFRAAHGSTDPAVARRERRRREAQKRRLVAELRKGGWLRGPATERRVLIALLTQLAASPAWALLVNLEDLWLEREPQNVPGTDSGGFNWRRKSRYDLEAIRGMADLRKTLRDLAQRREAARARPREASGRGSG